MSDNCERARLILVAAHIARRGPGRHDHQRHAWRTLIKGHTYRHDDKVDSLRNPLVHDGDIIIRDPDQRLREYYIIGVG